ncbi:membrane protein insertase YidC [Gammaproteobacteria bacterium]|nr:membrane protein insertase YidC [Gammaproteobacteria bacterium]
MDTQRVLLMLGLAVTSYMLILAWNKDYYQNPVVTSSESVNSVKTSPPNDMLPTISNAELASTPGIVPLLEGVNTKPTVAIPQQARSLVTVTTDVLVVKIDTLGGDIFSVALPKFPEKLETPDVPYILVNPKNSYVAQSGLIGPNGTDKEGFRPTFIAESSSFQMNDAPELTVTLTSIQEDGSKILKSYRFTKGEYLVEVDYQITNLGSDFWKGALFAQIKRDSQSPVSSSDNLMGMQPYVGGATRSGDEFYKKLEFDDIEDEAYKLTIDEGYIAMVQHYFVSAWVPREPIGNTYRGRKLAGQDVYLFGLTTSPITVAPGETQSIGASFYAGPKDQYKLEKIATGLELTVDYGFLWWLAQPLFFMLTGIHSFVGNWGLAIIGLTIIVKTFLYPLSAASFRSMAKMRKLQPEMVRLKDRFGDDRQQFSQAMMELYKKEGANPLGGCLPILLQMPVFLALYWTLMESVELRQAPFFLWIYDLSAMDPYFILPILMGISMFLTQRMQPEPPDPIQAKVFKFMPIMFTFFFLWFPSGLVLYWLVNNILSILQQLYVTRQLEKVS